MVVECWEVEFNKITKCSHPQKKKTPTTAVTLTIDPKLLHIYGSIKSIKIVLQWHISGGSPASPATIKGTSDLMNGGGMTVPVQRGSMAILQPPRSRFMITDILAGSGGGVAGLVDGRGSPSPQPRDLSVPPGGRNHHNNHHDDSDSDSSGQLDDHSVCSNGEL